MVLTLPNQVATRAGRRRSQGYRSTKPSPGRPYLATTSSASQGGTNPTIRLAIAQSEKKTVSMIGSRARPRTVTKPPLRAMNPSAASRTAMGEAIARKSTRARDSGGKAAKRTTGTER
jgi:hypothetical protein